MRFLPHVITRLLLDEIYSPVGIRFRFNINYIWVVDAVTDIINSSYIFHGIRTCIDYHFTVSNATINQVTEPQKCSIGTHYFHSWFTIDFSRGGFVSSKRFS